MKFNDLALPYPILDVTDPERSDFEDGDYQVTLEESAADQLGKMVFSVSHACSVTEIIDLVDNGFAQFCTVCVCPATMVREVFSSSVPDHTFSIDINRFFGKVDFLPQIVVTKAVEGFTSEDLNGEYDDCAFDLQPGDVIAVGDVEVRTFEFESLLFETLIAVRKNTSLHPMTYSVELEDSKVYIEMGSSFHSLWNELKTDKKIRPLLAMSIYKDCFVVALDDVRQDIESAGEKRWAASLMRKVEELGESIGPDTSIADVNQIAQKMLMGDTVEKLVKVHLG